MLLTVRASVAMKSAPIRVPVSENRPAGQRRAADDDGQDGVELDPQAQAVGVHRVGVGGDDQARDARTEPGEGVDGPDDRAGPDPGEPAGLGVDAHGLDQHPERRTPGEQGGQGEDGERDDERHGEGQHVARGQVAEVAVVDRGDLAVGDGHRDPAAGDHQDQGRDDRLDPEHRDQEAVPGTEQHADGERVGARHDGGRQRPLVAGPDDAGAHDGGRDRGDRTDGEVDAAGGDDQGHAQGHEQHRRAVADDVDEVAVEMTVLHPDVEEPGLRDHVDEQQDDQGQDRPHELVAEEPLEAGGCVRHGDPPPRGSRPR